MNTVVLPWPPKELSPNARLHWAALSRVKKAYRTACWLQARKAGISAETLLGADEADVHLVFYPPDKRNRDADNMLASMKAGLDGLADALKVDDNIFRVTFDVSDDIGGMVKVSVVPKKEIT
jgi:crossover junction endodeoxyribonuclease RusA